MKSYLEFRQALATRESSDPPGLGNAPKIVNKCGYIGKYQFGKPRLSDLGVVKRNYLFQWVWVPPMSLERFLADEAFQDHVFDVHVALLGKAISENFSEHVFSLSGGIAVAHLLGPGGFAAYLNGVNKADAFGTKASEYYKTFSDYEIPWETLPTKVVMPAADR